METRTYTVEEKDSGIRIDKFIALKLGEDYSRTYVKNLIDNEDIKLNGKKIKPRYQVKEGDEVLVELVLLPQDEELKGEDIPLDILYEDEWMIVINKPAGLVVHPAAGNWSGTLINALVHHSKNLADTGNPIRPGMVHRLDKDTSGVMVIAKDEKALRSLAKQFQKRDVKKKYFAIVQGRVELDNGIIEAPIARHAIHRKKMDVDPVKGRTARTIYHVKKRYKNFTLLEIDLETGRTHQIRVHMKHLGHPVLGDVVYGRKENFKRQALHAAILGFTHPDSGKYVEFHVPMPKDMEEILEKGDSK
jgi:23S rRNA pseudouridine1911/1915/1917 synthase